MKARTSKPSADRGEMSLSQLERNLVKATMAKYREHVKKYDGQWDAHTKSRKANAMYRACQALEAAQKAKSERTK